MENNKKSQNYSSRLANSKTSQSIDAKRKSDSQTTKSVPRFTRRREQSNPGRNEQPYRNTKQLPAKQRPNVDKRPRARAGGGSVGATSGNISSVGDPSDLSTNNDTASSTFENEFARFSDDVHVASPGLADVDETYDYEDSDSYVTVENESPKAMHKASHAGYLSFGGKKQNLNHLLNFQYTRRDSDYAPGMNVFGRHHGHYHQHGSGQNGGVGKKHKYNKEQFLQANFQFVVKSSAKLSLTDSPDSIIDWDLIEQINIQTTEEPQCPICLYPPIAAKLTRCGHAYCWPCILHYLALNDKTWRKCPICYEAIHVGDLKSTAILQQRQFAVDEVITFQLMRRKKGSLFVEKVTGAETPNIERYPWFSGPDDLKNFSKFLIAKRNDVVDIIERERRELTDDQDTTCPEYMFVQQALDLLRGRLEKFRDITVGARLAEEDVKRFGCELADKRAASPVTSDGGLNIAPPQLQFPFDADDVVADGILKSDASEPLTPRQSISSAAKYYYFYQSVDGQNIFLHPLNVKMLQACYGSLDSAPHSLSARILQREYHSMDEELRRKFTCLSHLPLTCQFSVVEVELKTPTVTPDILKLFRDDISHRQFERDRRDREEKKREKKIAAINDRQMGKIINSYANLDLGSAQEFPTFGFPEGFGAFATDSEPLSIKVSEGPSNAVSNSPSSASGLSYSSVISSPDVLSSKAVNSCNSSFPELSGKPLKNPTTCRRGMVPTATAPSAWSIASTPTRPTNVASCVEYDDDFGEASVKAMGATFGDAFELAILAKNNKKNKAKAKDNAKQSVSCAASATTSGQAAANENSKGKSKRSKKKFSRIDADELFS